MGGNTTNRCNWSIEEIDQLVKIYKQQSQQFYNPITHKLYNNKRAWKNGLAVKMSPKSLKYFLFALEPPHYSKFSGTQLTIDDYSLVGGFRKYTVQEIKDHVWMKSRNYKITDETKQKISHTLKIYNQTDRGIKARKHKSNRMSHFYSTDDGKQHKHRCSEKASKILKAKIATGEFTPPITNTWTHWNAVIEINNIVYKFRSSWEACFWFCNQHLQYETIRVTDTDGNVFINDFYDPHTTTLFEIKPTNRYNIEIKKMLALINYCFVNKIKFKWVNEKNIKEFIDENKIAQNESAKLQYSKLKKSIC